MKTFDEFKESRLRMDPAAAKMNDTQWEHAYVAYRRTREKPPARAEGAGDSKQAPSGKSSKRSRKSRRRSGGLSVLRGRIRGQSAYGDLRAAAGALFWIALGAIIVHGVVGFSIAAAGAGAITSLRMIGAVLLTVFLAALVVILRLLATVVIDIADIALHGAQKDGEGSDRESGAASASKKA